MKFWNLLSLWAGVAACSGAVLAARKVENSGVWIGWLVGLIIGCLCCLTAWKFGVLAIRRLKLYEPKLPPYQLFLSWSLCFTAVLWMFVSFYIGSWIAKLAIHLCQ